MTENRQVRKTRKKRRKLTPVMKLLCVIVCGVSLFFVGSFGKTLMETFRLQREMAEIQARLQEVQSKNAELIEQKDKLQDPGYVQNHSTGNSMISSIQDGVIVLPSEDE